MLQTGRPVTIEQVVHDVCEPVEMVEGESEVCDRFDQANELTTSTTVKL